MCGICGFAGRQDISVDQLIEMNDTMYHRGPNDSGAEIYPLKDGYTVGLAQRRLSILDLSSLGHQPMNSADNRVSIVFNGEIYNFLELKEQLSDYSFCSSCDTEVILAAYLKWGIDCLKHLNGMFAIAIFDRESEAVYLARDRVGKKPLYYWFEDGNLVFASELKPILKAPGFTKKIRKDILPRYLYQQYIAEPDTVFKQVYKVEPGEVIEFFYSELSSKKYWDLKEVYHQKKKEPPVGFEQAKEELDVRLKAAVKQRMIADVPLGAFLSGGYDSSLVTAIAQSLSEEPVKTFSIGFEERKYNEAEYAKEVATYLGCEHTEMYIGEKDMFRLIESIPQYYDEPFADSSQIPSMLVAELAKQKVTVALSGDGGDEFFCGYNVYDKVRQAQQLDKLGAIASGIGDIFHITSKYPFKVRVIAKNRNKEAKTQFIAGNYIQTAESMIKKQGEEEFIPCYYAFETKYKEKNWQERRMLLDMETYLSGDILCKVDRASMKYSLETRCPILDTNVIEYAFSLPHEYKYGKGMKKRILKELAYDYIPKEMLERRKTGFSVPLDKWLRGLLKEQVLSFAEEGFLRKQNIFEPAYVNGFLQRYMEKGDGGAGSGENYSRMVWAFFMFQRWYETYIV
ncbi:MAG: asparagine synthase (glutamine-hydrolyzing) [Lachnospiraceae bacterium]|nr:asparagine synthase (glutamine-hydrolyzing) [Lachnospiraceae bacterium]